MNYKTTLMILLLAFLTTLTSAEIDFRSDQPIDFYNDIVLQGDKNLDLNNNEIQRFFDTACPDGEAITNIDTNGTFECSTAAGAPGLPTILENDNTANQTLNLGDYRITNLGTPTDNQDAVPLQYLEDGFVNRSGDSLNGNLYFQDNNIINPGEIKTGGTGSDQIVIRDRNGSQDIARFNEGGNIEIPNGNLAISNNAINGENGNIELSNDVVALNRFGGGRYSFDSNGNPYIEDQSNNRRFEIQNGGTVEIINSNLSLTGNDIINVGKIDFTSGLSIDGDLNTSGGTIDTEGGNIALNGGYLSNDGDNEGISIDNSGNVTISKGDLDMNSNNVDNVNCLGDEC